MGLWRSACSLLMFVALLPTTVDRLEHCLACHVRLTPLNLVYVHLMAMYANPGCCSHQSVLWSAFRRVGRVVRL